MIVSTLEKRGDGVFRKTLSTKIRRRETNSSLQSDSLPEYFHLAVTDNPSTYLWLQRIFAYDVVQGVDVIVVCLYLSESTLLGFRGQLCSFGGWPNSWTAVEQAGMLEIALKLSVLLLPFEAFLPQHPSLCHKKCFKLFISLSSCWKEKSTHRYCYISFCFCGYFSVVWEWYF